VIGAYRASILIVCAGALWLALSAFADEPRVRITSPGIAAGAPARWRVFVYLQPHKDNRVVTVEADGDPGDYHRTDIAAPGEGSWKIRQVPDEPFRLSAGCYTFRATVKDGYEDDAKVLARAESQRLAVIGRDGYPCPHVER
jgi:hypothetical protein